MRLPFTGYEIRSRASIEREVAARVRSEADERAARLLERFARNPSCVRVAVAAHLGLSDAGYVLPNSGLIAPMERAIVAFIRSAAISRRLPVLEARMGLPGRIASVRRRFQSAMLR